MRRLSKRFSLATFGLAALLGTPAALPADVIVTAQYTQGASEAFTVSGTDLFQTDLASIGTTGTFSYFSANTPSLLADGDFGLAGPSGGDATVAPEVNATVTFFMDLSANTSGFQLTRLDSYASWDSGRDGQEYTVSYSTATNPSSFIDLITIPQYDGGSNGSGRTFNTKISLTDSTGVLADHVAAIRYTFTLYENNGTAYREIDAFGSAVAVPEPSGFLLASLGLAGVGATRVVRRRLAARPGGESPMLS